MCPFMWPFLPQLHHLESQFTGKMPASKSVTKAEERALAGENESQDSQLVLDEYMRAYGIGLVSAVLPRRWKSGPVPRPMLTFFGPR